MKRLLSVFLSLALLLSLASCGFAAAPSSSQEGEAEQAAAEPAAQEPEASGEEDSEAESAEAPQVDDGYIHIAMLEDFERINDDLSGRYILDADLSTWSAGAEAFTPIGSVETPFTGELNGNGHTISGELAYTGEEPCWGLFVVNQGSIHDLTLGTITCSAFDSRMLDYLNEDLSRSFNNLADMERPEEHTQVYGLLCGGNMGTLEHITVKDYASFPAFAMLNNSNSSITVGVVCGYNVGTIRDISMKSSTLSYSTMDDDTEVVIGLVCGMQSDGGTVEQVQLTEMTLCMDSWYGNGIELNLAPRVCAGLVLGGIEGESTLRDVTVSGEGMLKASFALEDADLDLGGLVGHAEGSITVENADVCVSIDCDARDDLEDYEPGNSGSVNVGGFIGSCEHACTLRDCALRDSMVRTVTRPYDRGDGSCTGGMVGCCGDELDAEGLSVSNALVDAYASDRDVYLGGLCGFCSDNVSVRDSVFGVKTLIQIADRCEVFDSNVVGYCEQDASFSSVEVNCGGSESNGGEGVSRATYYFAALAAGVEGDFSAENCTIDVQFSPLVGDAEVHDATEHEGMYNPV